MVSTVETQPDLFGATHTRSLKTGSIATMTDFVMKRLESVFHGGVVKYGLPLGYRKRHFYTLVFACANPNPKANILAKRLASAILKE